MLVNILNDLIVYVIKIMHIEAGVDQRLMSVVNYKHVFTRSNPRTGREPQLDS